MKDRTKMFKVATALLGAATALGVVATASFASEFGYMKAVDDCNDLLNKIQNEVKHDKEVGIESKTQN